MNTNARLLNKSDYSTSSYYEKIFDENNEENE